MRQAVEACGDMIFQFLWPACTPIVRFNVIHSLVTYLLNCYETNVPYNLRHLVKVILLPSVGLSIILLQIFSLGPSGDPAHQAVSHLLRSSFSFLQLVYGVLIPAVLDTTQTLQPLPMNITLPWNWLNCCMSSYIHPLVVCKERGDKVL
jgi:hypothetical protein